jgi:cell division protein YceG involved in septum cleavage
MVTVIFLCLMMFWAWRSWGPRDLYFPPETNVIILKGDSISKFYTQLSSVEVFRFKWHLRNNPDSFSSILEGNYVLSGNYTAQTFLSHIAQGPAQEHIVVRILE